MQLCWCWPSPWQFPTVMKRSPKHKAGKTRQPGWRKRTEVFLKVTQLHLNTLISSALRQSELLFTQAEEREEKYSYSEAVTPQRPHFFSACQNCSSHGLKKENRSILTVKQLHLNVLISSLPVRTALHTAAYQKSSLAVNFQCLEVSFWKSWSVVSRQKDNAFNVKYKYYKHGLI